MTSDGGLAFAEFLRRFVCRLVVSRARRPHLCRSRTSRLPAGREEKPYAAASPPGAACHPTAGPRRSSRRLHLGVDGLIRGAPRATGSRSSGCACRTHGTTRASSSCSARPSLTRSLRMVNSHAGPDSARCAISERAAISSTEAATVSPSLRDFQKQLSLTTSLRCVVCPEGGMVAIRPAADTVREKVGRGLPSVVNEAVVPQLSLLCVRPCQ